MTVYSRENITQHLETVRKNGPNMSPDTVVPGIKPVNRGKSRRSTDSQELVDSLPKDYQHFDDWIARFVSRIRDGTLNAKQAYFAFIDYQSDREDLALDNMRHYTDENGGVLPNDVISAYLESHANAGGKTDYVLHLIQSLADGTLFNDTDSTPSPRPTPGPTFTPHDDDDDVSYLSLIFS